MHVDVDAEELEKLPEDVGECEARAEEKAAEAERLCLGDRGTLDRYKTLVADVDQLTEASEQKQAAITKLQVCVCFEFKALRCFISYLLQHCCVSVSAVSFSGCQG